MRFNKFFIFLLCWVLYLLLRENLWTFVLMNVRDVHHMICGLPRVVIILWTCCRIPSLQTIVMLRTALIKEWIITLMSMPWNYPSSFLHRSCIRVWWKQILRNLWLSVWCRASRRMIALRTRAILATFERHTFETHCCRTNPLSTLHRWC
jgi:hypothetical protein